MCKTLHGTLLLLAIFVLFLNFSHATAKRTRRGMEIFEKNFIDKNKLKDVYDVFKYLYNTHSADTYLSNIKNESFTMNIWGFGEIEMVKTKCRKIDSDFYKCSFQREFYNLKRTPGETMYYISLPGSVRCRKLLSKLDNCPFEEQTEQLKTLILLLEL
ncbi:rCG27585, isoform CRA_d [Rattus norvegicus]|uniref:RCG27585, isoform CRA_d n=2 Tax=Rattus norvegicus TaxID=10116 RepID=A6K7E2_RAT|nr:cystatin-related protein 1 isoform X1 [Rattus norvegicus]EDL95075.1 rCG27585, isoform CRA_d [Rattus norvegicus]|eukprot:XP_006235246.1 PREDICTED: cystatin-related protein 1 isoform X1 [Rattus norvegicus]